MTQAEMMEQLIDGDELSSWDTDFHAYVKSYGMDVTLDGGFTAAELRWIADFIDSKRPVKP